jgi:hypothetical protein
VCVCVCVALVIQLALRLHRAILPSVACPILQYFLIIIIIIFNNCKWVEHPLAVVNSHITYARTMKVDYSRFSLGEGYMGSM